MRICVCGGGNLGHVTAGFFASHGHEVSVLTSRPSEWASAIEVLDCNGKVLEGTLSKCSSNPKDVIPCAEMVLICLPGYAIANTLEAIKPYLDFAAIVGTVVSSTGFFFEAFKILPKQQPLFGFQRVPFISRVLDYGRRAELKGYKKELFVAIEHTAKKDAIRQELETLFQTPVLLLDSFYEVSLSNSNPLLHPARLYTMWKDWTPDMSYATNLAFYEDWTLEASELLVTMDEEFQSLIKKIGLREGCIPPILEYYECEDALSLTKKIRSIPAFKGILSPMSLDANGLYIPDFNSRYFTEDFPYGMRFIVETAELHNVEVRTIEMVYKWGISHIGEIVAG